LKLRFVFVLLSRFFCLINLKIKNCPTMNITEIDKYRYIFHALKLVLMRLPRLPIDVSNISAKIIMDHRRKVFLLEDGIRRISRSCMQA